MIAIILTDVAGIAAEMERDQPIVDRDRIKLAENVRVTRARPGYHARRRDGREDTHRAVLATIATTGRAPRTLWTSILRACSSELIQCGPGCENIRRERVDIPERPGQHGCDHRPRDARRAVLAREWRTAGDLRRGPPTPGREPKPGLAQTVGMLVQVDRNVEQRRDLVGRTLAAGLQMGKPRIQVGLLQQAEVEHAAPLFGKAHESAQPVEHGAYGAGRQAWPQAALRLAQTGVEVFLGRETLRRAGQQAEIDAAMTTPGVLAEHGGRHVPAALAEQWQGCCGNARPDRQAGQHAVTDRARTGKRARGRQHWAWPLAAVMSRRPPAEDARGLPGSPRWSAPRQPRRQETQAESAP